MNLLSRIFRSTPSLRTRVVVATAIGAAIPVLIVGAVVWVGITNDRKERLDRRLDEAAGFAIPFLPRGLDEIPKSPNDQDAVITVRKNGQVTSNSNVVLPELPAGYEDTYVNGVRYRVRTVEIRAPEPMAVAVGDTYDATIADTNNLHRRVIIICLFAIVASTVFGWVLAAFAVRPFKQLAQQTSQIDAGGFRFLGRQVARHGRHFPRIGLVDVGALPLAVGKVGELPQEVVDRQPRDRRVLHQAEPVRVVADRAGAEPGCLLAVRDDIGHRRVILGNQSAGLYGEVISATVNVRSLPASVSFSPVVSAGMPPGRSQSRGVLPGHFTDQSSGMAGGIL